MKEYMVQMRFETRCDGEWIPAHMAYGHGTGKYGVKENAVKAMADIRADWEKAAPMKKNGIPIDYRIVSRTVTEWKPE